LTVVDVLELGRLPSKVEVEVPDFFSVVGSGCGERRRPGGGRDANEGWSWGGTSGGRGSVKKRSLREGRNDVRSESWEGHRWVESRRKNAVRWEWFRTRRGSPPGAEEGEEEGWLGVNRGVGS